MTMLCGIGVKTTRVLISILDSPEDFFNYKLSDLKQVTGLSESVLLKMNRQKALDKAVKIADKHEKIGVQTLFITSPEYPRRLKECEDAPILLYYRGKVNFNSMRFVAIVGMRDASSYGERITHALVKALQNKGVVVVSGLAYGIDTYAHKYCLQYNVPTIAVLGHGHDIVYPAINRNLSNEISKKGALISEFIHSMKPDRENFPKRNRIVAGLCEATIVIESNIKGGSLITAGLANSYNRDVFAFPGDITSERSAGCHKLIATQQAHLLTSADDLFRIMGWEDKDVLKRVVQKSVFPDLSILEKELLDEISSNANINIDTLSLNLKMPISKLNVSLFQLEMKGAIRARPGKKYSVA